MPPIIFSPTNSNSSHGTQQRFNNINDRALQVWNSELKNLSQNSRVSARELANVLLGGGFLLDSLTCPEEKETHCLICDLLRSEKVKSAIEKYAVDDYSLKKTFHIDKMQKDSGPASFLPLLLDCFLYDLEQFCKGKDLSDDRGILLVKAFRETLEADVLKFEPRHVKVYTHEDVMWWKAYLNRSQIGRVLYNFVSGFLQILDSLSWESIAAVSNLIANCLIAIVCLTSPNVWVVWLSCCVIFISILKLMVKRMFAPSLSNLA